MDFHQAARQARQNNRPEDMRRRELVSAAEWNCDKLKGAILNQLSQRGHSGNHVCGVYDIPYSGNNNDSVPYGNPFSAEWNIEGKRRGGLISFHNITNQSLVIRDLGRLDEFYRLFSQLARQDDITVSEPFLRAVFFSQQTNQVIREKRFSRGMGSLSARVRTDEHLIGSRRLGERAALLLSVDYTYTVR